MVLMRGAAAETKPARLAVVSPAISLSRMNQAAGGLFAGVLGELRRQGYVEGESLTVERYSAGGRTERLPTIVQGVVASKPDCILAQGYETAVLFKPATATIPIVAYANNPVEHGLIASFARPGGNITGFAASPGAELVGKRLQFLREAAPKATRIGFLSTRDVWEHTLTPALGEIEQGGLDLLGGADDELTREADYRRFFAVMGERRMEALVVGDTPENVRQVDLIQAELHKAHLPAIYPWRLALARGGLMSYGVDLLASGAAVGDYIARILKGTSPADLPYQQPTKFELVLNLLAARQMRLKFPQSLLARADEALE